MQFSLNGCPVDASVKDESGLPWGCAAQPFAPLSEHATAAGPDGAATYAVPGEVRLDEVARCGGCFGYINRHAVFQRSKWRCPICQVSNAIAPDSRYASLVARSHLPELRHALLEYDAADPPNPPLRPPAVGSPGLADGRAQPQQPQERPVFIALVDLTGPPSWIDLVKKALLAAVEALPEQYLVGLLTVSDRLGVYQLRAGDPEATAAPPAAAATGGGGGPAAATATAALVLPPPPHVQHVAIPPAGPLPIPLALLAARAPLFVPLPEHKAAFAAAVETLHSEPLRTAFPDDDDETAAAAGDAAGRRGPLGLGPALTAVVDYIADEPVYKHARLLALVQSRPTLGDGAVSVSHSLQHTPQPATAEFYRSLGMAAADAGVCIELCLAARWLPYATPHLPFPSLSAPAAAHRLPSADSAAPPDAAFQQQQQQPASPHDATEHDGGDDEERPLGLAVLHWLCAYSGGSILLYSAASQENMPQDVYRLLSRPMAFQCLLRLRTPPQMRATTLSLLQPSETYRDLLQLAGCDAFKTVMFEFDFVSSDGFSKQPDVPPVVQLAVSCAYLCPVRRRLCRAVRVHTVQLAVARSPQEVYEKADASTIVSVIDAKVLSPILHSGMPIAEARLVAQDWLIVLLSHYNQYLAKLASRPAPKSFDVAFSRYPNLKNLSRFVFALIKSPLLSASTPPPDVWIYLHSFYSNLPPHLLQRALYPTLSSWGAPNILSSPSVLLSASGLSTSTCRLFLLDALFMLLVFYLPSNDPSHDAPFPPPKDSAVRTTLDALRRQRPLTAQVVFCRAGAAEQRLFDALLVEEATPAGPSFGTFVDEIQAALMSLR